MLDGVQNPREYQYGSKKRITVSRYEINIGDHRVGFSPVISRFVDLHHWLPWEPVVSLPHFRVPRDTIEVT